MGTLLTLAIGPVMVLMFYFYRRDRLEPEPRRKVLKVMFLGALSTIPALILEVSYGDAPADHGLPLAFYTFLIVAASEELCKFGAVLLGIYNDPEFDEPFDGIVYCVAASLGFAALENLGYVLSEGTGVGILRALLAVPGHALFGAVAGYFVGVSRFRPSALGRMSGVFLGLATAILMHGAYDFCCFAGDPLINLCVLPLVGFYWWLALKLMKRLQPLRLLRWALARSDELVLALLAVLLFIVASNTQTGWLYVISSALGACLGVGARGPRRHLRGLSLAVVLPPLCEQDTLVLAELNIRGPARSQVQVLVPRQRWEHPGPDRVLLLPQAPGSLELALQPCVRGAHRLEGVRLRSRAPFGMFPYEVPQNAEHRPVLVYPQGPVLPGLSLGKARERPSPSGRTSRRAGASHDLRRLRPYQQGEDIRYVHWPTTARGLEVMVREFQDPGGQSLCLVLDNRHETGEYPHTSLEEAIRAAASLLVYAHRRQIPLTLCTLRDGWVRLTAPRLEQSRRLLAELRQEEGRLELEAELQRGGQEIVVLTSRSQDLPVRAERMTVVEFGPGGLLRAEQLAAVLS